MRNIFVSLFLFLLFNAQVLAQYAQLGNNYKSKNTSLTIILLDDEKGDVAASTTVVQGSCSGSITGLGQVKGKKLTFTPYMKADSKKTCVVSVEFNNSFASGEIVASDGCHYYSGASCGWEGDVVKKQGK